MRKKNIEILIIKIKKNLHLTPNLHAQPKYWRERNGSEPEQVETLQYHERDPAKLTYTEQVERKKKK